MSATIDDFRNFFKSDREKERFCINENINKILIMTKPMFTAENINIEFEVTEPYYTYGYPNEFSQVILNIISNARDILIEQELEYKYIHVSIEDTQENIIVSIEDNGGGIPEEIIDKVFDPYFSTKESKNGTGLGLYMVKMIIVEHMQADITVSNTKEGAIFKIILSKES